ncbi:MAG: PspA/IM30 family protein [Chthoniobacteraceae bacterium]|jgi:phage shock protein A|nr:PspA/IM30 family protein [Chthoniobacteraceae bacterium]NBV33319.1 PspA/IM30 family protein [Pseudomonadota bacterium]
MADNLFQAIHNWFRAKNQEAAEALSDPVRDGKLAITDSEKQIEGFTSKIATLIAETKSLERQTAESTSEVSKYQAVAAQALQAGNEADARDAITLKQKAEQQAQALGAQLSANKELVLKLREQLNTARMKVAKARSNITQLQARSQAAQIRTDLAKASSEFHSNKGGLAALDNLEKSVNKQETVAEAYEDLAASAAPAGQALLDKYAVGDASVEAELQRLKSGLLGGGSPSLSLPHSS